MGILLFLVIVGILSLRVSEAAAKKPSAQRQPITLANSEVRLTLGCLKEGFCITSLYCVEREREFIASGLHPLWTLFVEDTQQKSSEWNCITGPFRREAYATRNSARLTWNGTGEAKGITVKVTIILRRSRLFLDMSVKNQSRTISLMRVRFPSMTLCQIGDSAEDDVFLRPEISGILAKAPLIKGLESDAQYPGGWGPFQFVAHYDQDAGLYLGMHDESACFKRFYSRKTDAGIEVSVEMPAENATIPGNSYKTPGTAVLSTFSGDWFDAAQIFRAWASKFAPWWRNRKRYGRPDIPEWLKDICFWVRAYGTAEEAVPSTKRLAEFMGVPTAVHWYQWHKIPYDTDYPHYFPAKDGFAEGIAQLQAAGIRVMPYVNGRLWDSEADDFEELGRPGATKDRNMECYVEIYKSGRKLVPMCPTQPLWQKLVKEFVLRLMSPEFNVDGVYIDQIAAANPKECYDPSHGHPLAGGSWWMSDGYYPILTSLRRTIKQRYPEKFLTSECNAEPFAHLFDAYLTWHFQYNDMVPVFAAIYADKILTFGRAYGGDEPLAHRMRAAQALVFGEQLGWIKADILDKQPDTAKYFRSCARLRYRLLEYLSRGIMVRPPSVTGDIPEVTADWVWFGKMDVTDSALQKGAWKARDGSVAFVFANSSDEPISFTWHLDPRRHELRGKRYQLLRVTEDSELEEPGIDGATALDMRLEPRGVVAHIVRKK